MGECRVKPEHRAKRSPCYHQNGSVTYLTFPDRPFCIIFQMAFSISDFIFDNGILNVVERFGVRCVYFGEGDYVN